MSPAPDRASRYSLQVSSPGAGSVTGGLDFLTAPNSCGKPVAERGIKTFRFLAGAQQTHQPEILTYQPVGVFSLHGYVFSNL